MTTSPHGYALADSRSLRLVQTLGQFQGRLTAYLVGRLHADGFATLTDSQLGFLGSLDCGANYASAIARAQGISRQAVSKTVRELQRLGWLTTAPDPDRANQRVIVFTPEGERMMSCARQHFASLDAALDRFFPTSLDDLIAGLDRAGEGLQTP